MGVDLENSIWENIKDICENQLTLYDTTFDQDLELLDGDTLTNNQRACVLYRSGEKKILNFLIFAAENIPPLFKMSMKEAKKTVNSNNRFEECQTYIRNNVYHSIQLKDKSIKIGGDI
jgi:hypothetical protein